MIIKDPLTLSLFRGLLRCEWCKKVRQCVGNHVEARGMGGGKRLDHPVNLLAMCITIPGYYTGCHDDFHAGKITRADCLAIIAARMQTLQPRVEEAIFALLRAPKGSDPEMVISPILWPEKLTGMEVYCKKCTRPVDGGFSGLCPICGIPL